MTIQTPAGAYDENYGKTNTKTKIRIVFSPVESEQSKKVVLYMNKSAVTPVRHCCDF